MAATGNRRRLRLSGRRQFTSGFMLLFAAPLFAQDDAPPERQGIPVVGRPASDFYNAAGDRVKLTASAAPAEVPLNEWTTFTLTITNLLNAADIEKPSLKALPEFDVFQVDEAKEFDPPYDPARRAQRVFVYKLRPNSRAIESIPEFAFHYYDPKRIVLPNRPQDRFPKALSNAVPIHVTPPVAPPPVAATPLEIPAFALSLAVDDGSCAASPSIPNWVWALTLALPPFLAVGWVLWWKALYPDAAKLLQLKRHRAVRHALVALSRLGKGDDNSAQAIAAAMNRYLHERFDVPVYARTPPEIAAHLQSVGCSTERIEQATTFFRDCDAARFGPRLDTSAEMIAAAQRLIVALEEAL